MSTPIILKLLCQYNLFPEILYRNSVQQVKGRFKQDHLIILFSFLVHCMSMKRDDCQCLKGENISILNFQ